MATDRAVWWRPVPADVGASAGCCCESHFGRRWRTWRWSGPSSPPPRRRRPSPSSRWRRRRPASRRSAATHPSDPVLGRDRLGDGPPLQALPRSAGDGDVNGPPVSGWCLLASVVTRTRLSLLFVVFYVTFRFDDDYRRICVFFHSLTTSVSDSLSTR